MAALRARTGAERSFIEARPRYQFVKDIGEGELGKGDRSASKFCCAAAHTGGQHSCFVNLVSLASEHALLPQTTKKVLDVALVSEARPLLQRRRRRRAPKKERADGARAHTLRARRARSIPLRLCASLCAQSTHTAPVTRCTLAPLHTGAFGSVFLAQDTETGQLVAIKEMVRAPSVPRGGSAGAQRPRRRCSKLQQHGRDAPNAHGRSTH